MMGGSASTGTTSTCPVASRMEATPPACAREILKIAFDFSSPVPAAFAPAFCTKKTSSVGGCHTTASWNSGSVASSAMSVRVGSGPRMAWKAGS